MRIPSDYSRRILPIALCLSMALFVVTAAFVALVPVADATHEEERTTDGFKAYTPGGDIPNPGDVKDVQLFMVPAHMEEEGPIPPDVEIKVDFKVYYTTTLSDCDATNVEVLGIDEGNNIAGTEYDRDMLESIRDTGDGERSPSDDPGQMTTNENWDHRQISYIEFVGEDAIGQDPLYFHQEGEEDESIVVSRDCVEMPEPGWHRTYGMMNGTIEQFHGDRDSVEIGGESHQEGDEFEIWEPSLWYPVCECEESRHVAMRLDPPPGPMTPGSEGGVYHPNGTVEAPYASVTEDGTIDYGDFQVPRENVTSEGIHFHDGFLELHGPIYYAEGHVEEDGTIVTPGGEEYEPDPDEAPERTPTETPGGDDDGAGDDGAGDDGTGDDGAADDGAGDDGAGDDGAGDDGAGDDGAGDDGAGDDGAGDEDGEEDDAGDDDDGGTPAADGPGFGALAALVALLALVVAARRAS